LRPKYGFNLIITVLVLLLIIEAMLISYYCTTLVPLGSDLLGYSYSDIRMTIINSGDKLLYVYLLIGIIMLLGLFYAFYRITSKFYNKISRMYPFTIVLLSLFVTTLFTEGKPINQNKTQYLAINLYRSTTEDHSYTADVEYPLIKRPERKNVLGDYFELKEEKPNIVFIMVEGLGRDFVGEGAEYEGFTPFLDSLTTKSLYWENCLSNTGRTFGVLPSLLGSLPFGKSGFMELEDYPNKLTLYSILKNNGYHTSFYQGTNSSFDNVEKFLRSENIDFVLDKSGFGKNYELAAETAGFTWGYPDKELFKKSMSLSREEQQPRLEVYMTISTHEPFTPPNQDHYEGIVEKILKQREFDSQKRKVIEKNDNVFATLLYTDESLKWLFEAYKKQPNYDNTIFVVTGDHRLIPIPQRSSISRFHVPLIIYSPLLKSTRKMSAISSHFDVSPTLLSLLNGFYELKMPKRVAWMGNLLDTNKEFRSTKDIPLMRNKNELKDYVSGDKFYSDGDTYEIDENMDLNTSFTGSSKLESKLDNFMSMNAYVTTNNKIIPDSLAIFTLQKEKFTDAEIVWINSVYNGKNSDKAYLTARDLAFNKEYDRSLLLCRYILSEVPGNIDAKILMGRINGWNGNYEKAIEILKECIKSVPEYIDSYSALFDIYYWSGKHKDALELIEVVRQNSSSADEIADKIARARTLAGKNGIVSANKNETKQPSKTVLVATNK
ncbi:MAG: sulfatase-like hydrolase/transferase, partial [Pricia sp.]|nr:sulfatase-like hydrolase/transferase [Pricia sp.]